MTYKRKPVSEVVCPMCRRGFMQRRADQKYCSQACRDRRTGFRRDKLSTTERGYGRAHQQARAAAIEALDQAGVGVCCIGGEPIYPGQALHLDHTPDRSGYRGLACADHNRKDGAKRGREAQRAGGTRPARSRDWTWGTRSKAAPRVKKEPKPKLSKPVPIRDCGMCGVTIQSHRHYCSDACAIEMNARMARERYRERAGLSPTWERPVKGHADRKAA